MIQQALNRAYFFYFSVLLYFNKDTHGKTGASLQTHLIPSQLQPEQQQLT